MSSVDFGEVRKYLDSRYVKWGERPDTTSYGGMPWPCLDGILSCLGDVNGKKIVDVGSGDLRVAIHLAMLGADVTAIEKDDTVSDWGIKLYNQGVEGGFIPKGLGIKYIPSTDILDIPLCFDAVVFNYTEPTDQAKASIFRKKFYNKCLEINPGGLILLLMIRAYMIVSNPISSELNKSFKIVENKKVNDFSSGRNVVVFKKRRSLWPKPTRF